MSAQETQDLTAVLEGEGAGPAEAAAAPSEKETREMSDVLKTAESCNGGNPVFSMSKTSEAYTAHGTYTSKAKKLPDRFENPELIPGYGRVERNKNPMYQTTSSDIGALPPSIHTSHTQFHGRSQAFSNHLGRAGMPVNRSLNTYMDKSKAHSALDSL